MNRVKELLFRQQPKVCSARCRAKEIGVLPPRAVWIEQRLGVTKVVTQPGSRGGGCGLRQLPRLILEPVDLKARAMETRHKARLGAT